MGKPKESLPFGSSTLLGRAVETLLDCTWPVYVVGRGGDQELPPFPIEAETLVDDQPGAGPLAAMATGMRRLRRDGLTDQDAVFVTGCDAPFVDGEAIAWLAGQIGDHALVMPRVADTLQPLCAIYRLSCLAAVEDLLRQNIATPRTLVEKVRAKVLDEAALRAFDKDLRFVRSVNTPEEYERARRDAGG